ncbi:hypothetical protein PENTCL1PPCAC_6066, partial [Pristionchus entomophagus]
ISSLDSSLNHFTHSSIHLFFFHSFIILLSSEADREGKSTTSNSVSLGIKVVGWIGAVQFRV